MDRKPISSLFGLAVTIRPPTPIELRDHGGSIGDSMVIARKDNGRMVAFVVRDDLFDSNGNRFYQDA